MPAKNYMYIGRADESNRYWLIKGKTLYYIEYEGGKTRTVRVASLDELASSPEKLRQLPEKVREVVQQYIAVLGLDDLDKLYEKTVVTVKTEEEILKRSFVYVQEPRDVIDNITARSRFRDSSGTIGFTTTPPLVERGRIDVEKALELMTKQLYEKYTSLKDKVESILLYRDIPEILKSEIEKVFVFDRDLFMSVILTHELDPSIVLMYKTKKMLGKLIQEDSSGKKKLKLEITPDKHIIYTVIESEVRPLDQATIAMFREKIEKCLSEQDPKLCEQVLREISKAIYRRRYTTEFLTFDEAWQKLYEYFMKTEESVLRLFRLIVLMFKLLQRELSTEEKLKFALTTRLKRAVLYAVVILENLVKLYTLAAAIMMNIRGKLPIIDMREHSKFIEALKHIAYTFGTCLDKMEVYLTMLLHGMYRQVLEAAVGIPEAREARVLLAQLGIRKIRDAEDEARIPIEEELASDLERWRIRGDKP